MVFCTNKLIQPCIPFCFRFITRQYTCWPCWFHAFRREQGTHYNFSTGFTTCTYKNNQPVSNIDYKPCWFIIKVILTTTIEHYYQCNSFVLFGPFSIWQTRLVTSARPLHWSNLKQRADNLVSRKINWLLWLPLLSAYSHMLIDITVQTIFCLDNIAMKTTRPKIEGIVLVSIVKIVYKISQISHYTNKASSSKY